MLRRLLSRPLASRLAAVIPIETSARAQEILDKTLEVERGIERTYEQRLLAELFDAAGGGGRAIYGIAPTLESLWRGEVQTLVVAEHAHLAGGECPSCGRLLYIPDDLPPERAIHKGAEEKKKRDRENPVDATCSAALTANRSLPLNDG